MQHYVDLWYVSVLYVLLWYACGNRQAMRSLVCLCVCAMLAIPVKCLLEVAYLYMYIIVVSMPHASHVDGSCCYVFAITVVDIFSFPKLTHCMPDLLVSLEAQAIRGKDGQNRPAVSQKLIPH